MPQPTRNRRQRDVLPAKRRHVGQEIVRHAAAVSPDVLDGLLQVHRVPVHNSGGDQAEPRGPEALVFEGAVADIALAVKERRAPERIARLAFVEVGMAALAQLGIGQPLQG